MLEDVGEHGVAALVVGDDLLLFIRQRHGVAALTHEDAVAGGLEVRHVHLVFAAAYREERGLVDEVGQVGAAHAGRAPRHDRQVDIGGDALVLAVDLEDVLALVEIGEGHDDLPIEAPWAEEGGVEDVGPVGGGHHHDALGRLETVHLREHLVEGLLTLVVPATETRSALAADGVDLVDEDDARRLLARGLEQIADTSGAHPDEHLHEVGAGDRHERHAGLTRHRACDERLPRAGWADEQNALGDPRPDLLELCGLLEEVDDLGDLLLHAGVAGHVGEGRLRLLGVVHLGLRAADRHEPGHLARLPAPQPPPEPDEQADRQQPHQHAAEEVGGR